MDDEYVDNVWRETMDTSIRESDLLKSNIVLLV